MTAISMTSMNWNSVKTLPEEGQAIWVLCRHSKGEFPASFRIFGGIFECVIKENLARLQTCDGYGEGLWAIDWPEMHGGFMPPDDHIVGWLPAESISVPPDLVNGMSI